ncbi:pyridoxine 5'-phosphate synthase [Roseiterribacter gracilis]|uniref:Pyridoxine 5'-phosphate synthase n=1 Tax=Roseiterribacter gracilis TaxID=2812848 RepID=A0A8S8X9W3_9PROT|nr:pyridoxine 5'-phosphate synthase [Rhodospirillales bacterium TMPK1]
MTHLRLGINVDHVATVRNARGGSHPDPVSAAHMARLAGADGITAHLREDRRHIRDDDVRRLKDEVALPLNFEMAATDEMRRIALSLKPHAVCLVPERREERTTEGGLDVAGQLTVLTPFVRELVDAGIRVSMFVAADPRQLEASVAAGAPVVELHTGAYAEAEDPTDELARLIEGARFAASIGLEVHAGHGLSYDNVGRVAAIPELHELNIGHFLIGAALFEGLDASVRQMKALMRAAREQAVQ